jgi:hypothetical protein
MQEDFGASFIGHDEAKIAYARVEKLDPSER